MRIKARLNPEKHAVLPAFIFFQGLIEPQPIALLVDTGCTTTTILQNDVIRLGINCNLLPRTKIPVRTARGNYNPHVINNVQLFISGNFGFLNLQNGFLRFTLRDVHCIAPYRGYVYKPIPLNLAPSLLGMDVLKNFSKWRFTGIVLILES